MVRVDGAMAHSGWLWATDLDAHSNPGLGSGGMMTEHRAGRPRTYLGTPPGVGKMNAMLNDGWHRADDGEGVVWR